MTVYQRFLYVAAVAMWSGIAVANEKVAPPRVAELEKTYTREIVKAKKEVNEKYIAALERLQANYTKVKNFDAAIRVKEEIQLIKAYQEKEFAPPKVELKPIGDKPSTKTDYADPEELTKWKGDAVPVRLGDAVESIKLTASGKSTVKITRIISTRAAIEGKLTFRYKSSNLTGEGVELRGMYSNRAFKFRAPTLVFDGEWQIYEWPFNDIRGEEAIQFEFHVKQGAGEIYLSQLRTEFK